MPDEPNIPTEATPLSPTDDAPLDAFLGHDAYREMATDTFLKALKGLWTLDVDESIIPGSDAMKVVKDILVQIDDAGNFTVAAPAIEARIENGFMPDLAVGIKMGLEGRLDVIAAADEAGRFAISVGNTHVIEDQYVIAGDGMGADISIIASPIVRAMISKMPAAGFLSMHDDDGCTTMRFEGGTDFLQVLKRPAPKAWMTRIDFLGSLTMHETVPVFEPGKNDMDLITHEKFGIKIETPRFDATRSDPLLYKRGDTVKVSVVVTVEPKGTPFRLFGVSPSAPYMNFQSGDRISTGYEETVVMTGSSPLPVDRLIYDAVLITWNVQRAEAGGAWVRVKQPHNPSRSGPHRIFTTYGEPKLKNSYTVTGDPKVEGSYRAAGEEFVITERRIRTAQRYCRKAVLADAPGSDAKNVAILARKIQLYVNGTNYPLLTMERPSTFKRDTRVADRLFGLLDRKPIYADMTRDAAEQIEKEEAEIAKKDPSKQPETDPAKIAEKLDRRVQQFARTLETGNCWEASMIMEQLLRMIGVDATQVHVFGRATLPPLKKGENVSDQIGLPDIGRIQTRICEKHKVDGKVVPRAEQLYLNFNPWGDLLMLGEPTDKPGYPDLNEGEGCVRVGTRLYGGLSPAVAEAADGRTAAHNMLLALEGRLLAVKNAPPWRSHYQLWASPENPERLSWGPLPHPDAPKRAKDAKVFGGDSFCIEPEPGASIPGVPVPK